MVTQEMADRLQEIHQQMMELLEESITIVRQSGKKSLYDRAKAYWHPHIAMALSDDHSYIGKDGATMEEAVNALQDMVLPEEEDTDGE